MPIIEVWGDYGLFSRPELKVERVSYSVITPSAARGILEAIYWKPEFRWIIDRIDVLVLPKFITLRRNEVKDRVPGDRTVHRWMIGQEDVVPIYADGDRATLGSDQKGRTQRQTVAVKSPRYRIHAHIEPWVHDENSRIKFQSQFERRAKRGQCIYQPYLGCREFPAYFRWIDPSLADEPRPVDLNVELGWMLYDVFSRAEQGHALSKPRVQLFSCTIVEGVITLPHYRSVVGGGS